MKNFERNEDIEIKHSEQSLSKTENYDKEFLWFKTENIETMDSVRQRMEQLDVNNIELEGMLERHQEKIADSVETMLEAYPELKGYIGSIKVADLPEGVYACAGPKMGKEGFYGELQFSKELFSKSNLEWKLVDSETENFKGEKWLAGSGIEGVAKHEMGHLLHLQMISEEVGLKPGEIDAEKFNQIAEKYYYNAIAISICTEAKENLGIEHIEVARELSVYGSRDFGEFFAEAISEHETQKKPRRLANEVYRLYKIRQEKGEETI